MKTKWSVKKAAAIGLGIGVIGILADYTKRQAPMVPMQAFMDFIQVVTPAVVFAIIARLQHLFVRNSN